MSESSSHVQPRVYTIVCIDEDAYVDDMKCKWYPRKFFPGRRLRVVRVVGAAVVVVFDVVEAGAFGSKMRLLRAPARFRGKLCGQFFIKEKFMYTVVVRGLHGGVSVIVLRAKVFTLVNEAESDWS